MNNLLYLNKNEFFLDQGAKGPIMCLKQQNICFVFFHPHARFCKYSDECMLNFKQLPFKIAGAKFGLCNIMQNPELVALSKRTIAPITGVPYLVLYVNSRPFIRFDDDDRSVENMADFMNQIISRLQTQKKFIEGKGMKIESEIPKYSVGIPFNVVCDEEKGVCYLKYDDAYKKKA
jgi:hypothetical protein